jgi:hypothetical protein
MIEGTRLEECLAMDVRVRIIQQELEYNMMLRIELSHIIKMESAKE